MLQVFANEQEREDTYSQLRLNEQYNCNPSGLTPPTLNIVKKKFMKTREYAPKDVSQSIECQL